MGIYNNYNILVKLIENNNAATTLQTETEALKTAYKLNRENCQIDFTKPGEAIYNQIRGLSPYPTAWCYIKNETEEWSVKIYETIFEKEVHNLNPGELIATKKELKIAVINGFINVKSMQLPGKKRMKIHEILNGMSFSASTKAL